MIFEERLIENMTCFQTAFVPICLEYDRNPLMMALWGWGFHFEEAIKMYDGLKIDFSMDPNAFFEKYMNLQVEDVKKCDVILDIIMQCMQRKNDKVIVEIDAFNCPWDHGYKCFHVDHFFMIKHIDLDSNKFICIDWFVDKNQEFEFEIQDALEKMKGIKVVSVGSKPKECEVLIELLKGYKHPENILEEYNKFSDRFKQVRYIGEVFENDDINQCNIFVFLKKCRDYRTCIYEYLKQQESAEYDNMKEDFFQLKNQWDQLNYSLIRLFMRKTIKEKTINSIGNLIMEIGKAEKSVYDSAITYLRGKGDNG